MKDQIRLAVIMSCYNRRALSVRCINSLMRGAQNLKDLDAAFYIWDDGSTDGTADALEAISNRIRVYRGPGLYYWSKSMHSAMLEAVKDDYDLYLMVNDDVNFADNSLSVMLDSYKKSGGNCAIVGSSQFRDCFTYGGRDRYYNGIAPGDKLIECVYADWNCFLVDRYVINKIGIICGKYEHAWGDYDYSARLNRNNIPQFIATEYVGECEDDHAVPKYLDPKRRLGDRLRHLFSPKGEPIYSFFRFHWVDKRFKGIIIAVYSYIVMISRVVFLKTG